MCVKRVKETAESKTTRELWISQSANEALVIILNPSLIRRIRIICIFKWRPTGFNGGKTMPSAATAAASALEKKNRIIND